MNSIELLLNRQSNPFLTAPAPAGEVLENILKAGMRAPDHGGLLPWQFTIAQDAGLEKLSTIFATAMAKIAEEPAKIEKAKNMPFRAPMIIIITTRYQTHNKVPKQEQLVAAGCAAHAMQMAAFAQGYGAMWRTGDFSYNADVKMALDIELEQDIVGFLYIGSIKKELPAKPLKDYRDFTRYL